MSRCIYSRIFQHLTIVTIAITFTQAHVLYASEADNPYSCSELSDLSGWIDDTVCTRLKLVINEINGNMLRGNNLGKFFPSTGTFTTEQKYKLVLSRRLIAAMTDEGKFFAFNDIFDPTEKDAKRFDTSHIEDVMLQKFFADAGDCNYSVRAAPEESLYRDLNHILRLLFFARIEPFVRQGARGLTPTIRIGEHCVGMDKVGHFFDEAMDFDKPTTTPLQAGISMELGMKGLSYSGVFSYADIEANLAGNQFMHDLFRDPDPALTVETTGTIPFGETKKAKTDGWIKFNHCPKVSSYFSKRMSEVFNPNVYAKTTWGFDMKENVLQGLRDKIKKRAQAMKVNIETDEPSCADLERTSWTEDSLISSLQGASELNEKIQTAAKELAQLWRFCPEKLSFHNIPKFDEDSSTEKKERISERFEIRRYFIDQLVEKRLR